MVSGVTCVQLDQWGVMAFEEKRARHERTAEAFEAYLFEGKAPSIELQRMFQTFRAWLMNVYRSLKAFVESHPESGQLNDEVRGVFDRMLASTEEIQLAEQGRSMMPLFASAEQAGMTAEREFAAAVSRRQCDAVRHRGFAGARSARHAVVAQCTWANHQASAERGKSTACGGAQTGCR